MKRVICLFLLLSLCISLCACGTNSKTNSSTKDSPNSKPTTEQTEPESSTAPATEQTEPESSAAPVTEQTEPENTTEPVGSSDVLNSSDVDSYDGCYLLEIPFADQSIFSGPSYDDSFVQTVELAGVYTIVEECWDSEGNRWGCLKSGVGWVDLTDIAYRIDADLPVSANYADSHLLDSGKYHYVCADSSEYGFSVAFRAYEKLYDVRLCTVDFGQDVPEYHEVFYLELLQPDRPLVADIALPGDMSAYALRFTDSNGELCTYILTGSGRNNALVFYEY